MNNYIPEKDLLGMPISKLSRIFSLLENQLHLIPLSHLLIEPRQRHRLPGLGVDAAAHYLPAVEQRQDRAAGGAAEAQAGQEGVADGGVDEAGGDPGEIGQLGADRDRLDALGGEGGVEVAGGFDPLGVALVGRQGTPEQIARGVEPGQGGAEALGHGQRIVAPLPGEAALAEVKSQVITITLF
jgi:hypothetical protein